MTDHKHQTHAPTFPHPVYADHVLRPAFAESQRRLFAPMMAANVAHLIMLAETGIVAEREASAALAALWTVAERGADAFTYDPAVEDLFFAVEREVIALAGAVAGGNIQIARSRNDLAAAMGRLFLRELVLDALGQTLALRTALLELARAHVETLMPGTTHTQPAQPTTFAHYLGGVIGPLERDAARLRACYCEVNRSPLGAAAFTTTGFPIDRQRTAQLLGFDGVIENGYDAVGTADHMVAAAGVLVTAASSLSRFVHDLLIWSRQESGVVRVNDAFIQISSIMPQKRNPVVFEHIRARIAYVYGDADAVATMVHSSAFGDTNDVEDPIFVPLARCFASMRSVLELLTAVIASLEIDRALLIDRADQGFTTSTELADALVRTSGLPFRTAHAVVSSVVSEALRLGITSRDITAAMVEDAARSIIGRPLGLSDEVVRSALDPWSFVHARSISGGPAPAAMTTSLDAASRRLDDDGAWLRGARARLDRATRERTERVSQLIPNSD